MTCTLLAMHAPNSLVAFGAGGERNATELWHDVAHVAQALPEARPGSGVLLCVRSDRYWFSVGLLAAMARGHAVTLPPIDADRALFLGLAQAPSVAAVLHDTASSAALRVDRLLEQPRLVPPLTAAALTADPLIELHSTSGVHSRRSSQLLREAAGLAQHFEFDADTRLAASVLPGHAYGLVFSVLCPLLRGGAFLRETPATSQALHGVLARQRVNVLVSVPVQLQQLVNERLVAAAAGPAQLTRVFSSRDPLPLATALAVRACFGTSVVDIYGSSATSCVAQRMGEAAGVFSALPEVQLALHESGRLQVQSPWLALADQRACLTEDSVQLEPSGGFSLRGRPRDRWLRNGVAIALHELQAELACLPGVRDACVLGVPGSGEAGEAGPQLLAAVDAEPSLEAALRAALRTQFSVSHVPDQFAFMPLTRGGAGDHDRTRVLRAFGRSSDANPLCFELGFSAGQRFEADGETRCVYQVHVPANYVYFEGHFPGYPILPGAAQLSDMVLPCVRKTRPRLGVLSQMTRLKFSERIMPGDTIEVALRWRADDPVIEFSLRREQTVCATGRLTFRDEAADA